MRQTVEPETSFNGIPGIKQGKIHGICSKSDVCFSAVPIDFILPVKMSIKSDKWIRRMAEEQKMIEPFEPGQVRSVNDKKIVSYGVSSYGYDIRCADEFKIFTNINSTIVDPKNFDENSFVDVKSDVCIIPPNSFALARTVGWIAQWKEMISDPEQRIGRPRQLYVGEARRDVVPMDKRG